MSEDKSPLHARALRRSELAPGRRIIIFNIYGYESGLWTVVEAPALSTTPGFAGCLTVKLQSDHGQVTEHFLSDIGVVPHRGRHWSLTTFTIDAEDVATLPKPIPDRRRIDFGLS